MVTLHYRVDPPERGGQLLAADSAQERRGQAQLSIDLDAHTPSSPAGVLAELPGKDSRKTWLSNRGVLPRRSA